MLKNITEDEEDEANDQALQPGGSSQPFYLDQNSSNQNSAVD